MPDKLPVSRKSLVNKPLLNLGVPVEPLLEFLESEVVVLTDPVKLPLVICAEVVECLLL